MPKARQVIAVCAGGFSNEAKTRQAFKACSLTDEWLKLAR